MSESFTIQISRDLVSSLVDDEEKAKKKTRKPKPRSPREPKPSQNTNSKQPSKESEKLKAPLSQSPFFSPVPQYPQKPANQELENVLAVLKESEKVVERLQKQEESMVQQVTQRAKELHDKEFKIPERKPMPCLDEKDACFRCYKENVDNPLKCAQLVKGFADCARRVRQEVSADNA